MLRNTAAVKVVLGRHMQSRRSTGTLMLVGRQGQMEHLSEGKLCATFFREYITAVPFATLENARR